KFEFEKNPQSVLSAVHRHGIQHPVLNDPLMSTWQAYGVRAWPTLVLIDPHGDIVATWSGEGHSHAIAATIRGLLPQAGGALIRGTGLYAAEDELSSAYLQPGKIEILDTENVLVSDSGHHSLAIAPTAEPNSPSERIGSGERGFRDGDFTSAMFNEPYGAALVPHHLVDQVGYHVVVADTVNHALRGINLVTKTVITVAGTGSQWRPGDPTEGSALSTPLSTPWDVAWHGDLCIIAMAGDHRIWAFDPANSDLRVIAGTSQEGLVDNESGEAWFAQPSAVCSDGNSVWIVDSETSALRELGNNMVTTRIGAGLFDFGHIDGAAGDARLQHPLGLALHPDGSLYIADTYNGAIRVFDPDTQTVATVARDLAEPSDLCITSDRTAILVVESARSAVTRIPLANRENVQGPLLHTVRPVLDVASGNVTVKVTFTPPPGQKQDDRYGPSTYMTINSSPPELIISGSGPSAELTREIVINGDLREGVLHVSAKGASCDVGNDHAACHIHQQDWGVPVRVSAQGTSSINLVLSGNIN
ncbi:MAG: NHL domain-containing thioredoxin family protein, partial [Candidatus Nanopelagicales bacterium]|nr:NHL domain-containing thioredoxin family protein [Candidatus Nanopelagicales bacterium]